MRSRVVLFDQRLQRTQKIDALFRRQAVPVENKRALAKLFEIEHFVYDVPKCGFLLQVRFRAFHSRRCKQRADGLFFRHHQFQGRPGLGGR